jgi:hypothetical protein
MLFALAVLLIAVSGSLLILAIREMQPSTPSPFAPSTVHVPKKVLESLADRTLARAMAERAKDGNIESCSVHLEQLAEAYKNLAK